MDEKLFDKIIEMQRNLSFYEYAIGVMTSSLSKGSMQALVMNGSYSANALVKGLNDQIKKVVEMEKMEDKVMESRVGSKARIK